MTAEEQAWLDLVHEEALDPAQLIFDPHHHLWDHPKERLPARRAPADTGAGHNVTSTVFVDCMSRYRTDGPEALRPVGETELRGGHRRAQRGAAAPSIAAIVSYADLRLGAASRRCWPPTSRPGAAASAGSAMPPRSTRTRRSAPTTSAHPPGLMARPPVPRRPARAGGDGPDLRRLALPPSAAGAGRRRPRRSRR